MVGRRGRGVGRRPGRRARDQRGTGRPAGGPWGSGARVARASRGHAAERHAVRSRVDSDRGRARVVGRGRWGPRRRGSRCERAMGRSRRHRGRAAGCPRGCGPDPALDEARGAFARDGRAVAGGARRQRDAGQVRRQHAGAGAGDGAPVVDLASARRGSVRSGRARGRGAGRREARAAGTTADGAHHRRRRRVVCDAPRRLDVHRAGRGRR